MTSPAPVFPENARIPVDLFVSKKHPALTHGDLGFADASDSIVYKVNRHQSSKSSANKIPLLDSSGNPLISIYRYDNGSWQGFKGDDQKELIFRVKRTLNKLRRRELEVFLVGEDGEDSASELKVKGCPFQRSCTIYSGNDIVAQTSLMYKLRQLFVRRVEADVLDGICGVLSSSCKLMGGNHSSLERWKLNTVKGGVL